MKTTIHSEISTSGDTKPCKNKWPKNFTENLNFCVVHNLLFHGDSNIDKYQKNKRYQQFSCFFNYSYVEKHVYINLTRLSNSYTYHKSCIDIMWENGMPK